jgi:hypothetical protein
LIIALYIIHPRVTRLNVSIFGCREIEDGEYWLQSDLNIRCWNQTHYLYSLFVSFPSILVFGLGFPLLILFSLLFRFRMGDKDGKADVWFGFLVLGFDPANYYWSIVIWVRKILIGVVWAMAGYPSIRLQAAFILLILIGAWGL